MASDPDDPDLDNPDFLASLVSRPDDEMLDWLATWWMAAQTKAKGIPLEHFSPQLAEVIWLETLNSNPDSAANAALLQVMKDIILGNRARAAKMFREAMVDSAFDVFLFKEVATSRRKQRERASLPRGNELTLLIRQVVQKQPGISEAELFVLLEKRSKQGCPVVEQITDGIIHWTSKKDPTSRRTKVSALRSILSREKSKFARSR